MRIVHLAVVVVMLGVVCAADAPRPASFPGSPIEIIVPFAVGGGLDQSMRIVAKHAEREFGQTVNVRNLTAGGNIKGNQTAVNAAPDGLVWGSWGMGLVTDQLIVRSATYTYKDVVPVAMVSRDPHIICISAALALRYGISDLRGLLEAARQNPGKIVYGTGGNWTSHDFARLRLEDSAGGEFVRMPFLGGALAISAVATGNCDVATSFGAEYLPYVDDPQVIPLAVTSETRLDFLPELPTAVESGYPELLQSMWQVISLPKQTPKPLVNYIASMLANTMNKPGFKAEMRKKGFNPVFMAGEELSQFIENEYQYFYTKTEEWGIRIKRMK